MAFLHNFHTPHRHQHRFGAVHKIIAGCPQFHVVEETVKASAMSKGSMVGEESVGYWLGENRGGKPGDGRASVAQQGSDSERIDWTLRESARAKIRVMVKRILNKYGYPPDLQEEAVKTVLAQAELLCAEWV